MKPHKCPVCDGTGTVSRPPWVGGDVREISATVTPTYPCRSCDGTGIVWERTAADYPITVVKDDEE